MTKVVTGLFDSPADAATAVQTLEQRGVPVEEMSMVAAEGFDADSFGIDSHSKLPEGVALGAGTGGAIGALVAGLTAAGTIATGGAGLVVAGPIVAALAGAGAGAAGGSVLGGLIGAAIPEHEVKHYENAIEEGSILLGVHCEDRQAEKRAKQVFEDCGAESVSTV